MLIALSMNFMCLTSCSDDDDEPEVTSPIVGVWRTQPYSAELGSEVEFTKSGKFRQVMNTKSGSSTYTGKYEATDTEDGIAKVYLKGSEDTPVIYEYSITNNNKMKLTMVIPSSATLTFYRQ